MVRTKQLIPKQHDAEKTTILKGLKKIAKKKQQKSGGGISKVIVGDSITAAAAAKEANFRDTAEKIADAIAKVTAQKEPIEEGGQLEAAKHRKPHRFRPGTVSLREIRKYQKGTELLIRRRPFQRLVREIAGNVREELRFTPSSMEALQHAAEDFVVHRMEEANLLAFHAKRVTIMAKDMKLVKQMQDKRD